MASIARLDDNIQINKFNVTTWTGDYGINTNGFPKWMQMDGSYDTLMDETPTEYPSPIDKEDETHFDPLRLNIVTWDRPGRPRVTGKERNNTLVLLLVIILIFIMFRSKILKFLKA